MSTFFAELAAWENAPETLAAFERVVARPLPFAAAELHARLYRNLIERMLDWWRLPAGPGAEVREWSPLFRFAAEADPFYITEGQVADLLARCPPIPAETREPLAEALHRYFALLREGFPASFPSPLLSEEDCRRWSELLPPDFAWRSLQILHAAGLYPIGGREGFRAWHRYQGTEFSPQLTPQALRQWQGLCGEAAKKGGTGSGNSAHALDFLAAAFAGGFSGMARGGPCGEVPECRGCGLREKCGWARGPAKNADTPAAVLGRLGHDRAAHLSVPQLMQGVFGLSGSAVRELALKLEKTPLRKLAGKNLPELEEWLGTIPLQRGQLQALFEFCRRYGEERLAPGVPLRSAEAVFRHFRTRLREAQQEHFLVVLLDSRRCYLGETLVALGTLNESPVHPREIFNAAIRERAASLLIVHNHPSGDPTPSDDDRGVTRRISEVGRVVGIPLVDHIIIAEDRYVSFLEYDMM